MEKNSAKSTKVIKAGIGYTIGNYLIKGLSFFTLPIFTRILSTEDYGLYNTFFAYEAVICILIGLALHSSLKNAKYKYEEKFEDYISSCILLILLNFLVWCLGCNFLYDLINKIIDLPRMYINLLLIYSLGSALILFFNNYVGLYYRYQSFVKLSTVNAVGNVIISILLILTVFDKARGYGRIVGMCVPVIGIGIFIIYYFFKKSRPAYNEEYWNYGLRYSLPIVPHGVSQMILLQFDRIMINSIIGESAAGIYGFSYSIYSIINITATSLDSVYGPWFYEKMKNKDYQSIRIQGGKIAYLMLLFSTLMILVTPEMVKILGAQAYWEGVYTAVPLVVGGYFAFLYILPATIEYYYEKTKYIMFGTCAAALINVVANYICINAFGYIAAAYTTLFTYLLYFIFHYFLAKKIHGDFIYDSKQLFLYTVSMLVINFFVVFTVEYWYLRWGVALVLGIYSLVWANRQFNILNVIKKKFGKKD